MGIQKVMAADVIKNAKTIYEAVYDCKFNKQNPTDVFILDQLLRNSSSICLNYCEGHGRHTPGQVLQFVSIARGSAYECTMSLEFVPSLAYLKELSISICDELDGYVVRLQQIIKKG